MEWSRNDVVIYKFFLSSVRDARFFQAGFFEPAIFQHHIITYHGVKNALG